jgi:two-component system chemotaxis sensor kinase CheA
MEKFRDEFYNEASEQLEALEGRLLELEQAPNDNEIISAVFRIMHTIKGGAGMFGFDDIKDFTHEIETAMEYVRDGKVLPTPGLVSITLNAKDHIKELLDSDEVSEQQKAVGDVILKEFRDYVEKNKMGDSSLSIETSASTGEVERIVDNDEKIFRIRFKPAENVFLNGTNPILLLDELAGLGEADIEPDISGLPAFDAFDPEKSYLSWHVDLVTSKGLTDIQDVFIFLDSDSVVDVSEEESAELPAVVSEPAAAAVPAPVIGEEEAEVAAPVPEVKASDENSRAVVAEPPAAEAAAVHKPEHPARSGAQAGRNASKDLMTRSIKIDSEKLDKLVDLVGELVTFSARLGQISQELENSSLIGLTEQADRLITELRDTSMGMRMVPIGATFNQFRRTVRDLSNALGKDVQMVTEGEETELDKTVIERLNNPMMHLVRNSMDHGIEMPAEREKNGKPGRGTIKLMAEHSGAFVNIVISDDGAGLNREKILAKAVDKGLVSSVNAADLSDQDIYDLIFAPGFSTADKITDVSGRGVGMDVVKKEITALGGTVQVVSEPGKGSSFILKIPLTLAIIEGLMAKIADAYYIFPLASVEECNEFVRTETEVHNKTDFINWRDQLVPYVNLRAYFDVKGNNPESEQIVIVNDRNAHIGFVVDRVIGNLQTVIKPLGKFYRNVRGISGATILGDGTVALILDMFKLADMISQEDKRSI